MRKILALIPLALVMTSCNEKQATCNCNDTKNIDSIVTFAIIKDTTYVDVNDELSLYPKIDTSNYGTLHVQQVIQVSCGYPKFTISSNFDTLVINAKLDTSKLCVDWTAKFRYEANVSIIGHCKYVRFTNSNKIITSNSDALIRK